EYTKNMADTGIRGALSGVEELVTFLETASTSDRSAFSRRANVIFECRTCASLFRKADGFMRHVMRCDGSRTGDADSEFDRRIFLTSPIYSSTAVRAPGMVPLKRPLANGVVPAPNVQSSTLQQQNLNVAKTFVKAEPAPTMPKLELESGTKAMTSLSPRPQKRTGNRVTAQKVVPGKIRKIGVGDSIEVTANSSAKSRKSSNVKVQDLSVDIRPSRMRKTPKWLEKEFVV
ncbi:hypothetical protein Angca_000496, partial [Angiostrongylus cantonensis]